MRVVLLSMVLILGGCLATQPPHNPLKKEKKEVAVVAPEAPVAPPEKPEAAPGLRLPELPKTGIDRVELMKEMFLVQQDLKSQILKLAESLSDEDLAELNRFLSERGVTIERKRVPKSSPDRRAF